MHRKNYAIQNKPAFFFFQIYKNLTTISNSLLSIMFLFYFVFQYIKENKLTA